MSETLELEGPLNVRLQDGSVYQIRPGPYGKGLNVHAVRTRPQGRRGARGTHGAGHRGRPPLPSTLALRALLEADAGKDQLKEPRHYHGWLLDKNPGLSPHTARQTVYREHAAVAEAHAGITVHRVEGKRRRARKTARKATGDGRGPGRKPSPATTLIRERLARDAEKGNVEDATTYSRWLVHKADIGMKKARPIVYRELRALKA